jgi:subtilisin family serine protease
MYRVFPCSGGGASDILLAGMSRAAADRPDVISMSFGGIAHGLASDPFGQITDGLGKRGIAVFAANGNDGDRGIGFESTPGIGRSVFAVGSVMNDKFPVTYHAIDLTTRRLRYSSIVNLNGTFIVQVLNFGEGAAQTVGCNQNDYLQLPPV